MSDPRNKIAAYFACKQCREGDVGLLSVGLSQDARLQVECDLHGPVGAFELANPPDMSKLSCTECGTPLDGREHRH